MPTLTREKTEAVIALLTEYGEVRYPCSFAIAHRIKTVAIAVITRDVPTSASTSEERDIIIDSLWSSLNPRPAAAKLKTRTPYARISVYEIHDRHRFQNHDAPSLTRIEIALRRLQESCQPFTLEDVLEKAAIAPSTFAAEYPDALRRLKAEVELSQRGRS